VLYINSVTKIRVQARRQVYGQQLTYYFNSFNKVTAGMNGDSVHEVLSFFVAVEVQLSKASWSSVVHYLVRSIFRKPDLLMVE
jgi:hypothetical protein